MEQRWYIRNRGRISGPFGLEELKELTQRGQFRRFYQVSEDGVTWSSAATLNEVFDRGSTMALVATPEMPVEIAAQVPQVAEWYFVDENGRQEGPVSRDHLLQLFSTGRINESSLVWSNGMSDWLPLSTTGLTGTFAEPLPRARSMWPWLVGTIVTVLCLATVGGAFLYMYRDRLSGPLRSVAEGPSALEAITGVNQDERIAAAVGLVVCGFRITHPNGHRTDMPLCTGTCFAVSADGDLITNKHVIEDAWDWSHATLLLDKVRREQLLDVRPTVWVFFKRDKETRDRYVAEIVHVSERHDFGILKIKRKSCFFRLSSEDDFRRGRLVAACGFPGVAKTPHSQEEIIETIRRQKTESDIENQFKNRDFEFTLTDGTINRVVTEQGGRKWIEHSALINPGNSGGPLVNEDGVVLGINTLLVRGEGGSIFSALALHQLKTKIDEHIPNVTWK